VAERGPWTVIMDPDRGILDVYNDAEPHCEAREMGDLCGGCPRCLVAQAEHAGLEVRSGLTTEELAELEVEHDGEPCPPGLHWLALTGKGEDPMLPDPFTYPELEPSKQHGYHRLAITPTALSYAWTARNPWGLVTGWELFDPSGNPVATGPLNLSVFRGDTVTVTLEGDLVEECRPRSMEPRPPPVVTEALARDGFDKIKRSLGGFVEAVGGMAATLAGAADHIDALAEAFRNAKISLPKVVPPMAPTGICGIEVDFIITDDGYIIGPDGSTIEPSHGDHTDTTGHPRGASPDAPRAAGGRVGIRRTPPRGPIHGSGHRRPGRQGSTVTAPRRPQDR
jgi:hypothetical protein